VLWREQAELGVVSASAPRAVSRAADDDGGMDGHARTQELKSGWAYRALVA
jgi:hypothetical protein